MLNLQFWIKPAWSWNMTIFYLLHSIRFCLKFCIYLYKRNWPVRRPFAILCQFWYWGYTYHINPSWSIPNFCFCFLFSEEDVRSLYSFFPPYITGRILLMKPAGHGVYFISVDFNKDIIFACYLHLTSPFLLILSFVRENFPKNLHM